MIIIRYECVKDNSRWRIGNGLLINVWTQPWLRNQQSQHVTTPPHLGPEQMTIVTLIDHNRQC